MFQRGTGQHSAAPDDGAGQTANVGSPRGWGSRPARVWWFRGLAIVFPFLSLWLIECGLRWCDVGVDSTLVLPSSRDVSGATHYFNPRVDVAYCTEDLRGPEPRGFALPRPAGLVRILVVGASSVQGYPYPSELAFPRQMECILERQLDGRRIEVLNAGIVGLSTTPLVDLVSQCRAAAPSLIVLYAGHNEFYGVGGVSTNARLSPQGIQVRKLRLGQILTNGISQGDGDGPLVERLPAQFRIPAGSPAVAEAAETYRSNVSRIVELCATESIPLLLCSPVCNLRGQSPLAFPAELVDLADLERERDRDSTVSDGDGSYLTLLRQRVSEHPHNAILQYRLAQFLETQGQPAEAAAAYSLARDLDPCRYRAPDAFGDVLSDVASDAGDSTHFVDLRPLFAQRSRYCVPGDDLFLEHIHFTLEGHWLAAQGIAQAIVEDVYDEEWNEDRLPSVGERDEWLGVVPEDRLVGSYLALFLRESPPFDQAVDESEHVELLRHKIEESLNGLGDLEQQCFTSLPHQVQIDDLIDGLGRARLEIGDTEEALKLFQRSTRRRPWMPNGYVFSAVCYFQLGDEAEARRCLQQSRSTVIAETARLLQDERRLEAAMRNASGVQNLDNSGAAY